MRFRMYTFELGPIRPPSEFQSILLRITRNCPWNKCAFCHTYKNERFSMRNVDEVKADIDSIVAIAEIIRETSAKLGATNIVSNDILQKVITDNSIPREYVRQVAYWMSFGMKSLFLQDADSLIVKTAKVVDILNYIRRKIPSLERITTYARAKTISMKTIEELSSLREAGLTRIHMGMESGSDKVLALISKGVTAAEIITAGKNIKQAGFELSEYFIPGLGGADVSTDNAVESARVLNEINPDFIRLRSIIPLPGTPLGDMMKAKTWLPLSETEKVREIQLFIENLNGITSTIASDHVMNLLEDIEGVFPADKNAILNVIHAFLNMNNDDKDNFIIGRRLGRYRYTRDYTPNAEIREIKSQLLAEYSSVDEAVLGILSKYI